MSFADAFVQGWNLVEGINERKNREAASERDFRMREQAARQNQELFEYAKSRRPVTEAIQDVGLEQNQTALETAQLNNSEFKEMTPYRRESAGLKLTSERQGVTKGAYEINAIKRVENARNVAYGDDPTPAPTPQVRVEALMKDPEAFKQYAPALNARLSQTNASGNRVELTGLVRDPETDTYMLMANIYDPSGQQIKIDSPITERRSGDGDDPVRRFSLEELQREFDQVLGAQNAAPVARSQPAPAGDRSQAFVEQITPFAIAAGKKLGVDPKAIMAQAAHETGWGKSTPPNSHNYFGIKADKGWKGPRVTTGTREEVNGQSVAIQDGFRSYGSMEESVDDYVRFVQSNPRYAQALKAGPDAGKYFQAMQDAGYATDSQYAQKLNGVYQSPAIANANLQGLEAASVPVPAPTPAPAPAPAPTPAPTPAPRQSSLGLAEAKAQAGRADATRQKPTFWDSVGFSDRAADARMFNAIADPKNTAVNPSPSPVGEAAYQRLPGRVGSANSQAPDEGRSYGDYRANPSPEDAAKWKESREYLLDKGLVSKQKGQLLDDLYGIAPTPKPAMARPQGLANARATTQPATQPATQAAPAQPAMSDAKRRSLEVLAAEGTASEQKMAKRALGLYDSVKLIADRNSGQVAAFGDGGEPLWKKQVFPSKAATESGGSSGEKKKIDTLKAVYEDAFFRRNDKGDQKLNNQDLSTFIDRMLRALPQVGIEDIQMLDRPYMLDANRLTDVINEDMGSNTLKSLGPALLIMTAGDSVISPNDAKTLMVQAVNLVNNGQARNSTEAMEQLLLEKHPVAQILARKGAVDPVGLNEAVKTIAQMVPEARSRPEYQGMSDAQIAQAIAETMQPN